MSTPAPRTTPRRASLAQERSRRTRRELVAAAISLWSARGFENGIETTTIEEIANAAGVTKGTFYFHFAHKEDILLELGYTAVEGVSAGALEGLEQARPAPEILAALVHDFGRVVERTPRIVVLRSLAEFHRRHPSQLATRPSPRRRDLRVMLAELVAFGREQGDYPPEVDPEEVGALLEVVLMEAMRSWAAGAPGSLIERLERYVGVVTAGALSG